MNKLMIRNLAAAIAVAAACSLLQAAQPASPPPSQSSSALRGLDSDCDGLPDDADPDPILAAYTAMKWEVTSVSLDYDVTHQARITGTATEQASTSKVSKGAFSWSFGADGRLDASVRASGQLSLNPFALFGLRNSGTEFAAGFAGSAFGREVREKTSTETEEKDYKQFLSITDESAAGNLHLGFSVNIRSLSGSPLLV
jgi:hypothetical protein